MDRFPPYGRVVLNEIVTDAPLYNDILENFRTLRTNTYLYWKAESEMSLSMPLYSLSALRSFKGSGEWSFNLLDLETYGDHQYVRDQIGSRKYFYLIQDALSRGETNKYLRGQAGFPSEGVVWGMNPDLGQYLNDTRDLVISPGLNRGLAWNEGRAWTIKNSSSMTEYSHGQVEPFIRLLNNERAADAHHLSIWNKNISAVRRSGNESSQRGAFLDFVGLNVTSLATDEELRVETPKHQLVVNNNNNNNNSNNLVICRNLKKKLELF